MKHEIQVPEVSEGVTAGTVVALSVAVGATIEEDQTLLELETDKAVIAIPSPYPGQVTEIRVAEGDNVAVGAVIMTIETGGVETGAAAEPGKESPPEAAPEPAPARPPEPATAEVPEPPTPEPPAAPRTAAPAAAPAATPPRTKPALLTKSRLETVT